MCVMTFLSCFILLFVLSWEVSIVIKCKVLKYHQKVFGMSYFDVKSIHLKLLINKERPYIWILVRIKVDNTILSPLEIGRNSKIATAEESWSVNENKTMLCDICFENFVTWKDQSIISYSRWCCTLRLVNLVQCLRTYWPKTSMVQFYSIYIHVWIQQFSCLND